MAAGIAAAGGCGDATSSCGHGRTVEGGLGEQAALAQTASGQPVV